MPASPEDFLTFSTALASRMRRSSIRRCTRSRRARPCAAQIPGGHSKNLFVKDKKSRLFLLTLGEETLVDLKRVHEKIGANGRVSFGSAELLEEVWGVRPGAVTPFGAINDKEGRVTVVLDSGLMAHETGQFPSAGQHPHHRRLVRGAPQVPARDRP